MHPSNEPRFPPFGGRVQRARPVRDARVTHAFIVTLAVLGIVGQVLAALLLVAGLLVAYLSLFPAAFAMVVARLRRSLGVYGAVMRGGIAAIDPEASRQMHNIRKRRYGWRW